MCWIWEFWYLLLFEQRETETCFDFTIVSDTFVQANAICTTTRTKKLTVGLALVNLLIVTIYFSLSDRLHFLSILASIYQVIVLQMVLPVTVLVINMMLVYEMRRASNNSAANLGLQQHQQSQSAVPTVMLVSTSLVYVLLQGTPGITIIYVDYVQHSDVFWNYVLLIARASLHFIYTYNFYVYLITGKQFRSDLRTLFYRCSRCSCTCSSSSSSSSAAAAAHNRNDIRLTERTADSAVWNFHCWRLAVTHKQKTQKHSSTGLFFSL